MKYSVCTRTFTQALLVNLTSVAVHQYFVALRGIFTLSIAWKIVFNFRCVGLLSFAQRFLLCCLLWGRDVESRGTYKGSRTTAICMAAAVR